MPSAVLRIATDAFHSEDMYAPESVDLLQKSGIDLQRHDEMGIEPNDFAELMITSGLVLMEDVKWISFHRCAAFHSSFLVMAYVRTCAITVRKNEIGAIVALKCKPCVISIPHPILTFHTAGTILATSSSS